MAETTNNAPAQAPETPGARLAAKRAAKSAKKAAARGTQQPGAEVAKSMLWATSWLDQNTRTLLIGVGAIAVAGAAWAGYSMHSASVDRDAGALLRTAITTTEGFVTTGDEPAPEDLLVPTFASVDAREKKALDQFRDVEKKFPDSAPARWAKLGEANTLLGLGKYPEATAAFTAALANTGDDAFLHSRALEGLGYSLESEKKDADAIKRFEELSKLDNGAYSIIGDYQRARVLAKTGARAEALKILEAMLKAVADKPADAANGGEHFASIIEHAQTLLTELGGQAPQKAGGVPGSNSFDISQLGGAGGDKNALTKQVMDALRKQLAEKKPAGSQPAGPQPQ